MASVPDFQDAEDLLQNVAVACLRKFEVYDPRWPFLGWALGMAKIEIARFQREHARKSLGFRSELLDELALVYDQLAPELEARTRALRECQEGLEKRASKMIRLRYECSLNAEEIGTELKLSSVNVRVMLSRVRTVLRECIERKLKVDAPAF